MPLELHENCIAQPYSEAEMKAAAEAHNASTGYLRLADRILIDGATHGWQDEAGELHRGYSYPGEETEGKDFGGLHCYNTRQVYQQVPDRRLIRDYLMDEGGDNLAEALLFLLEKYRTEYFIKWVNTRPDAPEIRRYLSQHDPTGNDGLLTEYGDPSCEIRSKPPDAKVEVVTPSLD